MSEQSTPEPTNTLVTRLPWEQAKENIRKDPARYSAYNRLINIDPLDEWFDMKYGYPLNVTQWYERQVLERHIGDSTMVFSQYVLKIESERNGTDFRLIHKPVSLQVWLSNNPEGFRSYVVFPGGFVGIGSHHDFVIKNLNDTVIERFANIADEVDENGYRKWYRQMKEVTRTLRFAPPEK